MDTEEYLRGKAEERDPRKRKRLSSEMGYDGDRVEERSRWVVRVVWWFTVVVSVSGDMINCSIRSRERSNRRGRSRSRSGSKEDSRYSRRERGGGQAQGQEDDWRKRSDAFLQKLSGLPTDPRLAVQAARQQSYQVRPCQLLSGVVTLLYCRATTTRARPRPLKVCPLQATRALASILLATLTTIHRSTTKVTSALLSTSSL